MKEFRIKADATFLAEDVDDAFKELANYFRSRVEKGTDAESIFISGEISVFSIVENNKNV